MTTTMPNVGTDKNANPLKGLLAYGQSPWMDYIRRDLLTGGGLKKMIQDDGLRGMTSNPTIFEKAIAEGHYYDDILNSPDVKKLDAKEVYEKIAIRDVQDAADIFKPVYAETKGRDGYVSLEVSPLLSNDTQGTLAEARRLWKSVNRPNVMIKVPGTKEGLPAIRQLLEDGININITLLFAQSVYEDVAQAYLAALEARAAKSQDVSQIASVASFFVSRIDTLIDKQIDDTLKTEKDANRRALLESVEGKVAIANARLTYRKYHELFSTAQWNSLAAKGAQTQRLLWASTSTKNPKYRDVLYVEELIGADTVDTIPPATFDAFRDHGKLRKSLTENVDAAAKTMADLEKAGISMRDVTEKLVVDGVKLFADAFHKLLDATGKECWGACVSLNKLKYDLPEPLEKAVEEGIADWKKNDKVRRLWQQDATLWTGTDENKWLGWLGITAEQLAALDVFKKIAADVKKAKFKHVLLLGMGGSSLCPEVLRLTFGKIKGFPELHVLDSTDPAQIKAIQKKLDLKRTICIVSSKSGSTLEPNIYKQYFFEQIKKKVGDKEVGKRFIAITDPASNMQQVATRDHFRDVFYGVPSIGGRYSALSNFGMIPGAVMGMNIAKFLKNTEEMVKACNAEVSADVNPGAQLGIILGTAANQGRDKLTIIASPGIHDLGAWLEQLIAESTGKIGKGIIPVDREALGKPTAYGNDRVFAYLRLQSKPNKAQDAAVDALERNGQPVVRIAVKDTYNLGQEFFRWEIATAVAGSIIGIDAFNQPDVEASKIETRKLTSEYEKSGKLPAESPFFEAECLKFFADEKNAAALAGAETLRDILKNHLDRVNSGDYFGVLGYITMNDGNEKALQKIRHAVRDQKKVATVLGFGPRFLHSTGQAYKGGPDTGVFLQITCDDAVDLPVPDQKYTFSVVKAAQARGDFAVLAERGRRALRVHLTKSVSRDLAKVGAALQKALK